MVLTTKHAKTLAIFPPRFEKLRVGGIDYFVDTDKLGTFSGEIERKGTVVACARNKFDWSFKFDKIESSLAGEGSFRQTNYKTGSVGSLEE